MRITRVSLMLCALLAGCAREGPASPAGELTPEEFVDVYVALRGAQATAKSPAEFEELKKSILQKAGTTPEALTRFVRDYSGQVEVMSAVWDSIQNRVSRQLTATPQ